MEDEGLKDAIEAFFEAGKSGDFDEAALAYRDMCRLSKGGYEEEEPDDEKGKKSGDGPLALLVMKEKK